MNIKKIFNDKTLLKVQELVSEEMYKRWDEMLLNTTLSSLGDIQPCPRMHCQYPVTIEEGQGSCPSCKFVFCGLCRYVRSENLEGSESNSEIFYLSCIYRCLKDLA